MFQINSAFQPIANMFGGKALPHDIRKISGNVEERCGRKPRVMNKGEKPNARTDARSDDSNAAISLVEQPVRCPARVQDSLADRRDGPSDIWRDQKLSPFEVLGLALMVIR